MTSPTTTTLDELERLLAAATPGPWIRRWESMTVHHPGGDGALTTQQDVDLAIAAVNALPALIAAARAALPGAERAGADLGYARFVHEDAAQPPPPAEALRVALERLEHDGLIVILGLGDPEERTDFTMAPAEAAAALRSYLAATEEGTP